MLADLPFGAQHGSVEENVALYPAVLSQIAQLLRPDGCCVLLTNTANLPLLLQSIRATRDAHAGAVDEDGVGKRAARAPLRTLYRRQVPLGFMPGWMVVATREDLTLTFWVECKGEK